MHKTWRINQKEHIRKRAGQEQSRSISQMGGKRRINTISEKQHRPLSTLTLNPDNFITTERLDGVMRELQRTKIRIASVRETDLQYDFPYKKWI